MARLAALAVASLALAACGGDDGGSGGGEAASAAPKQSPSGGAPEVTQIKAAAVPAQNMAPLYIGINEGVFEKYGLQVEPVTAESGPAGMAQLVSGDLHVGFSNYYTVVFANLEGLDVRPIAEGARSSPDSATVEAMPDSGIKEPADLVGRKLAVNSLRNNGDIGIRAVLDSLGVDGSKVEFVELPFGQMGAALEKGTVDAAWMPEPLLSQAKETLNTHTVLDWAQGPMDNFPESGYIVSGKFAEENPNTIAAFQCALRESVQMTVEDRELRVKTVADFTKLPVEVVEGLPEPNLPEDIDPQVLSAVTDELERQKLIDEPFDLPSLAITAPETCTPAS